jgi:hypothetical protein
VTRDLDAAEERARLAAADLATAANDVIARYSVRWRDAQDEVDFANLSRWTRYYPARKLDDAREDLSFATRAQAEVRSIAASIAMLVPRSGAGTAAPDAQLIRRLVGLADECERRAIHLRSR